MKKKSLLFRLFAVVAAMMCALGIHAQEAYACYTSDNTTLTFYYDNYRSLRPGTTYDLNTGTTTPGWETDRSNLSVTQVVFNSSFAYARPTTTYDWFYDMGNLQSITGMRYLNTSEVTNMSYMFDQCNQLTSIDVSHFNTANVTKMTAMFTACSSLTSLDLSSFNTSQVTDMRYMFNVCSNLQTIYVGDGWSTTAVTSSGNMFGNCTSLVGGKGTTWDSSNPTDKTYAHIDGGTSNPGYFSDINPIAYACYTESNTTLTFYYDTQRYLRTGTIYNLNEGSNNPGWVTDRTNASVTKVVFNPSFADARPTTTYSWFYRMAILQSIEGIEYLNTSEVTNMAWMISSCTELTTLDLSHFNTSNVTIMGAMFYGCSGLTSLDLSHFNTSKVTDMGSMFNKCSNLTSLDLSSFNTSNVTQMGGMFYDNSNLQTIYVGIGWSTAAVTYSTNMFYNCTSLVGGMGTTYDENHVEVEYAHIDGGSDNPGYFTAATEAYACYTSDNTTLTFYYDNLRSSRMGTTYDLNTGFYNPGWITDHTNASVTKVVFDPSFADARPTTTYSWFYAMENLQSITGMEYLNTSEVTEMSYMFAGCNMTSLDLSSFNTSKVTNMSCMFDDCSSLTSLDLSSFNTSQVTDMCFMFSYCISLTSLDLSSFNTSQVTNMDDMFSYSSSLTSLDLSSFNTSKVTDMDEMFNFCSNLTSLDLSSFNTSHVTHIGHMFYGCSNLRTIYVGSCWTTAGVVYSEEMFYRCQSLVGGMGTTFKNSNPKDKTYAHIDGGPSNPGYFTEKPAFKLGDVNGDGVVDIDDVTMQINVVLGNPVTGFISANADLNGDERIDIDDVTLMINMVLGN